MRYRLLIIILLLISGTSSCGSVDLFRQPIPTPPSGFTDISSFIVSDQHFASTSLSADGHILATIGKKQVQDDDGDGQLFIIDMNTAQVLFNTEESEKEWGWGTLAISPDGKYVATCVTLYSPKIYIVDWKAGTTTYLTDGCFPAWSPDGNHLAYVLYKPNSIQIRIRDLESKMEQLVHEYPSAKMFLGELVWSPTQDKLAFTTDMYTTSPSKILNTINVDGSDLKSITGLPQYLDTPQFSPDGTKILYVNSSQEKTIQISDLNGLCHQIESPRAYGVSLSTDGSTIAIDTGYGVLTAKTENIYGNDFWSRGIACP